MQPIDLLHLSDGATPAAPQREGGWQDMSRDIGWGITDRRERRHEERMPDVRGSGRRR
ncbi:hypothetical protein GCM10011579_049880 [Streptomyces albiflavescens]|uniref:Uncharacterized protein n=1 Tax=Streptomyces albiflavescens TaxID=1623582 RepID=A0A917Y7R4_9ACTN|nr:hypothetical protein GCM10011579_049880 [Streptomyces albiflavescens]